MSDTPRTDAIVIRGTADLFLRICRQLERELAAAQAALNAAQVNLTALNQSRDEWVELYTKTKRDLVLSKEAFELLTQLNLEQDRELAAANDELGEIMKLLGNALHPGNDLVVGDALVMASDVVSKLAIFEKAEAELPEPPNSSDVPVGQEALPRAYYVEMRTIAAKAIADRNDAQGLLNHAVSLLSQAALSDDGADGDDCLTLIDDIQKGLRRSDKTSDWHYNSKVYDRLCAALGIDNSDEIDVMPLVEKAIAERNELRAECEALRKDAERYRWLSIHCRVTAEARGGCPEHAALVYYYGLKTPRDMSTYTVTGLATAIDAAIAAEGDRK